MNKILFCASTASHIRNFHLPYIKALNEDGYDVWVATNSDKPIPYTKGVVAFPFTKSFLSPRNIAAVFKLRNFLKRERFDKISTHTALASAIIRLAVLLLPQKQRPRVYYIAHGFLFSKKDGFKKWLYLLPEKICAPVTNMLMVMNQEDLELAKRYCLYKEQLHLINGIGFNSDKFKLLSSEERENGRRAMGFSQADFLFIYAAEFSKRKNQQFLIKAFATVANQIPHAHLLLAGNGALLEHCKKLVKKLQMEKQIHFLGYMQQMQELYPLCDAAVSTSKVEGIPFNVLEAMSCGLPVLLSNIKGHRDLVENKEEFLFDTEQELCKKLVKNAVISAKPKDWTQNIKKYRLDVVKYPILQLYLQ
ncbi:MAG: glycosyltransferase [Faecalispora sporosphaeroides]|uniref:Glycosyltransferase family 4 protein n=1 Tax=Faecalispora sporosphaeroides TaxID=1549 RepID=A0A928KR49_9FIRM|nr:glycosyltransferase [Faecalispora sporosphaeroides]MBE6833212.1 glycosyltransferase family 4 protein [Faecalispora sporosphaeroides]